MTMWVIREHRVSDAPAVITYLWSSVYRFITFRCKHYMYIRFKKKVLYGEKFNE